MTTNPGRLSASAPSPYSNHEPIEGRPLIDVPVFMKVWAGVVVDGFGLERPNDTHLVGNFGEVRKDRRHLYTGFTTLLKRVLGSHCT